jgi:hypothetical protein
MAAVDTAASAPTTTAVRVRDLRTYWRRTLAVLMVVPMTALAVEVAIVPLPVRGTIAEGIAGMAAHPGRTQAALWLALLFGLTVLPATMAAAWAARRGAPRLTLAAGVLLLLAFSASLPDTDLAQAVAADKRLDPALVTAIDEAIWAHPAIGVQTLLFLLGQGVGFILLGIALWRARVVPAWAGILLAVSGPAHVLVPGGNAGGAASWAMTAIGYAAVSVALWRTPDAGFDLPPGDAVEPNPDTGPRTAWRTLLAVAAVPVAIYVTVFRYLLPYDDSDTPREIFDKLVASPTYVGWGIWVGSIVGLTGCAGVLAVAWLTRRRTPVLTTVALFLAVPGYLALFAGGAYGDVLASVTATVPGIDRETAFQIGWGMESSAQSNALGLIFVAGHLFGTILLGVALWRARLAPTWLAVGLTVSQPIHLASVLTGIRPIDLVGWGLTAVGFAWAAWRLLRMRDAEFDLPPATPVA